MNGRVQAVTLALVCLAASVQGATNTWNNDGPDALFATADNWVEDAAPVSTNDTVVLDASAGTAYLQSEFTIGSGQSMTAPGGGVALRLGSGDLTVATGGTLDFASSSAALAENTGGGSLTFEPGSAVALANVFGDANWTWTFTANTSGVSVCHMAGFWHRGGTLELDLTSYDPTNGNVIILIDYAGLNDVGVFSATNVTGAPVPGSVNYAYNQGGGDYAIAYVLDIPFAWDDGGSDSNWNTAANWNFDAVPGVYDEVVVGSGYTVTNGQDSYGSLLIEAGASVTMGAGFNGRATRVEGTLDFAGGYNLYGSASLAVSGSLGTNMTWLVPRNSSTVSFSDGASLDNPGIWFQLNDTPTLEFTLSETGFSTLEAGRLYDGNTAWSNVTFNIDISAYDTNNGPFIDLIDFTSHGSQYDPPFDPTVTITGHKGGILSFNQTTHTLTLHVPRYMVLTIR
jgi:hypothetical protein